MSHGFRLRAVNLAGHGAASVTVQVRSGTGTTPTAFRVAARAGHRLTFAWVAPAAGFVPTGYELEAGVGAQVLGALPTGGPATQFTVTAPDGTFFVRVVATDGALRSAPSDEIVVSIGASTPPSAPRNLLVTMNSPTIALSWTTTLDGGEPTSMPLLVGGDVTFVSLRLAPTESAQPDLPRRRGYEFFLSASNAERRL